MPKRLTYLSQLYELLTNELNTPEQTQGAVPIGGFSIYEVDGAWKGAKSATSAL